MNKEPDRPYIYQPDGIGSPGWESGKIFSVTGPGVSEEVKKMRFTRGEAERLLKFLEDLEERDE